MGCLRGWLARLSRHALGALMVYVDNSKHAYGRMIMCHMIADTPAELHLMADRIGVARRWFQRDASAPHYDICRSKRGEAVALGAVEVDRRGFVDALQKIKQSWPRENGRWK